MQILLRDKRTGTEEWVPLEQATKIMDLEPGEIEWMLGEFGECETDGYIAIHCEELPSRPYWPRQPHTVFFDPSPFQGGPGFKLT